MGVFNYATYAKNLETGILKTNMTKIAKTLFEPIIIQNKKDMFQQTTKLRKQGKSLLICFYIRSNGLK
ncbi:hypothetical protein DW172_08980 [Agathobacter rectalis]|mgnify:CR=1 FL=1|jgi:hypothetical protein|uniref:Uncharacterized protein n=1 Tax=Agathobacter rectalis TaxID=39491 RepID=A0A414ZL29_9FIRM|nr:hypothetical protein DW172_08980 [Agathobacter rectalis]